MYIYMYIYIYVRMYIYVCIYFFKRQEKGHNANSLAIIPYVHNKHRTYRNR